MVNLHRLASGQDENFLTECFVQVLRELIRLEPAPATDLLKRITNNKICLDVDDLLNLNIQTQVSTDEGVPDIEFRVNDCLIYIEVKVESGFAPNQVSRYKRQLSKFPESKNSQLGVLTKNHYIPNNDESSPDFMIRWIQLGEWIENLPLYNELSKYITSQFIELLKYRGLFMETVNWELVNGIKSFRNLIEMIGEVLVSNNINPVKTCGWNWFGYYTEDKKFFYGIYFDSPNTVEFNTEKDFKLKDIKSVEFGEINQGEWSHGLDLTSEESHFFSRGKTSQMKCLEEHYRKCYEYAKTIGS